MLKWIRKLIKSSNSEDGDHRKSVLDKNNEKRLESIQRTEHRDFMTDLQPIAWPPVFFGMPMFPIWEVPADMFLGDDKSFSETSDIQSTEIKLWSTRGYECHEDLCFRSIRFESLDLKLARQVGKPQNVYLFDSTDVVGSYGDRSLIIKREYRGLELSTILICAKSTVLQGIPNPDRGMTLAGRSALIHAHRWAVHYNNRQ